MAKKNKSKALKPSRPAAAKQTGKKKAATPAAAVKRKTRAPKPLALALPLARARKLAGDLYQSAGLAFWSLAIEAASDEERETLIDLQESVCEAADALRGASAAPSKQKLFWVASFDREGLPVTPPRFIFAAREEEAVAQFKAAYKEEAARRKPRAQLVPLDGATQPQD